MTKTIEFIRESRGWFIIVLMALGMIFGGGAWVLSEAKDYTDTRVKGLESQLDTIQEDTREIRQYLMGGKK